MSLVKSNLMDLIKKQYLFKIEACSKFFITMIITQILGIMFAINVAGSNRGTSDGVYSLNIMGSSTIPIFMFTIACVFGATISLNLKEYKDMDFTFISNRMSSNLSNIAFLITLSLFGAVTTALSGCVIRAIKYLLIGSYRIVENGFFITPGELMCSIGATFLYILLFCSIVYFFCVLVQKSNVFMIVILAVVILLLRTPIFKIVAEYYGKEHNFVMFMVKVIITCVIFFTFSIFVSNKAEVRR